MTWRAQMRGLAHPEHWQGPQGALFERFGAVKASPMAAYKLLRQGESVLLFPGGGREVRDRPCDATVTLWTCCEMYEPVYSTMLACGGRELGRLHVACIQSYEGKCWHEVLADGSASSICPYGKKGSQAREPARVHIRLSTFDRFVTGEQAEGREVQADLEGQPRLCEAGLQAGLHHSALCCCWGYAPSHRKRRPLLPAIRGSALSSSQGRCSMAVLTV